MQSIIMILLWYIRAFAYIGMQFNVEDLGSTVILSFTTMGVAEILASLMSAPIKRKFKRKNSMQVSLLISSIACFATGRFTFSFLIGFRRPR